MFQRGTDLFVQKETINHSQWLRDNSVLSFIEFQLNQIVMLSLNKILQSKILSNV